MLLSWMIYYARSRLPFFLRPSLLPGTVSGITLRPSLLPFFVFLRPSLLPDAWRPSWTRAGRDGVYIPSRRLVERRETRGLETLVPHRVPGVHQLGGDAAHFDKCVEPDLLPAEDLAAEFRYAGHAALMGRRNPASTGLC